MGRDVLQMHSPLKATPTAALRVGNNSSIPSIFSRQSTKLHVLPITATNQPPPMKRRTVTPAPLRDRLIPVMSSTDTPNSRRSGNSNSETESRPIHTAKELHVYFNCWKVYVLTVYINGRVIFCRYGNEQAQKHQSKSGGARQ